MGIIAIFVGVVALIYPKIVGIIAIFINLGLLISLTLTYPENVAALITLSLMIFGLEPIISGIVGRWI
ncbi:MAG: hypothetical protein WAL97_02095 [Halobacteriota archaeon]